MSCEQIDHLVKRHICYQVTTHYQDVRLRREVTKRLRESLFLPLSETITLTHVLWISNIHKDVPDLFDFKETVSHIYCDRPVMFIKGVTSRHACRLYILQIYVAAILHINTVEDESLKERLKQ